MFLKPYDNRSDRQFDIVEIVYDFVMTRAARATKIACDNRKQKSYRVNRPLRWLVPVFHARVHVRLPTREEPPARKAKQIWRRSALFAKGYLAHFEKKFVFTRDWITKKVLSYFKIWKKSASGAQCSCFSYKFASVL